MTYEHLEDRANHVATIVLACLSGHESPDSLTVGETRQLCADTAARELPGMRGRDQVRVVDRAQTVFLRLWHKK